MKIQDSRFKIQDQKVKTTKQKGYTLLFAVITAALVLGVGVFILGVSKKQYALSVTARESMYSLYAADSAMECAVAALGLGNLATTSSSATITCNGSSDTKGFTVVSNPDPLLWNGNVTQAVGIVIPFSGGQCGLVDVRYGSNVSNEVVLRIEARGYNQCSDVGAGMGPTASPRTVERALRLTKKGI